MKVRLLAFGVLLGVATFGTSGCMSSSGGSLGNGRMSDEEWIRAAGRGTVPYAETLDRFDVSGENGPIRGTVYRREGENLDFWWPGGSTEWEYRPLRVRLASPRPFRNLCVVEADPRRRGETRRKVSVAGPEETAILSVFHQLISRYIVDEEADEALATYRRGGEGRALFDENYRPLENRTLGLLDLTRFLEQQGAIFKQGAFPYWERRALVYLSLRCNAKGMVESAEILANYDRPETADSLLALVKTWALPTPDWEGREPRRFKVLVPFAHDRAEKLLARAPDPWWPAPDPVTHMHRFVRGEMIERTGREGEPLPGEIRKTLENGSLSGWTRVFRATDSAFGWDDFLCTTTGHLPRMEVPSYWNREAGEKRRRGLLLDSPGEIWVLDPFFRLAPGKSRAGATRLPGWAVLPVGEADTMWAWVWPEDEILLAAWAGEEIFVLVGWSTVAHPRIKRGALLDIRVPTIWVGNVRTWTVRKYLGAPIDPRQRRVVETHLESLVGEAYPGVGWN